ncbi:MAG TPA: DUF2917 domain-containing protein [Burkholderiales bacterium]|nr:DUF2917 domain-containing protein [Burkholderiales bacterium]
MKIELERGRLLKLRRPGSRLTVHSGSVWITEKGVLRDVILRPGESFVLGPPGVALLEACSDAALSYEPEGYEPEEAR